MSGDLGASARAAQSDDVWPGCRPAREVGVHGEVSGGEAVVQERVESRGRVGRCSKKPAQCHGRTRRYPDGLR